MCSQIFSIFRSEILRLRALVRPAVDHHDGVEGHADDRAALDERLDLLVGELAVPVGQRAAIVMAGPERARSSARAHPRSSRRRGG